MVLYSSMVSYSRDADCESDEQLGSSGCLKTWLNDLNLFEKQTKLKSLTSISIDTEA